MRSPSRFNRSEVVAGNLSEGRGGIRWRIRPGIASDQEIENSLGISLCKRPLVVCADSKVLCKLPGYDFFARAALRSSRCLDVSVPPRPKVSSRQLPLGPAF